MSQNINIYFWENDFPHKEWRKIIDTFTGKYNTQKKETYTIHLEKRKADQQTYIAEWVMYEAKNNESSSGTLWISLRQFTENLYWGLTEKRPNWEIGLHWNSTLKMTINLPELISFLYFLTFKKAMIYDRRLDKYFLTSNDYKKINSLEFATEKELKIFLTNKGKIEV